MKNTKTKLLGLTLSASFVLSSLAPAVASASAEDVATSNYAVTQIDPSAINPEKIKDVIDRAESLKKIVNNLPVPGKGGYLKALDKIIGTLKNLDPSKAGPRVELASDTIEAIRFSIKDIQNKTKKAHVDIGVEITKAALVMVDPYASNEKIAKASEKLQKAIETAKESADITAQDVATIYVKKPLANLIEEARKLRRNKDLTEDQKAELNKAIKEAVHTKNQARVTVGEITAAQAKLQNFLDNFTIGKVENPTEEETIDPEFNDKDVTKEEDSDLVDLENLDTTDVEEPEETGEAEKTPEESEEEAEETSEATEEETKNTEEIPEAPEENETIEVNE
ncbi:CAMP factor family pore-forming toxin [Anaerococcus nagyae]|jgi:immediate-early protein|uniref:cAMP factor n=1 Tax=Anaerococcus nagyae TaxID=1755241 RepID=A0A3E2TI99_9FIRM|nr:CAMP factor family pore-forming toxin [Anaerococcus nagyae]RGB76387.1 hypothetical protein DXA39_04250 [Anaerococcus nagyae]